MVLILNNNMRQLVILTIIICCLESCKSGTEKVAGANGFQILIADTTWNRRAQWDLRDLTYRSKLANQLALSDLKKGADSLEVRLWCDFSFSNSQDLYVLKFKDTNCLLTYFRIYPRSYNYDDASSRDWDPYTDPIVDSSVSKSVLLTKSKCTSLNCDSIWYLKSQSELKISDHIGFTDCDSYIIEIADRKRYKYLNHHCAMGYYKETKLSEILTYLDFCDRITSLATKYNATIPYNYN